MGQLFCPVGLAAYYPHPEGDLPVWKVIGALAVLACISAGVLARWRRYPYLLVGWLWYVGMLIPVIGLVQVGKIAMADRYTYLPQIGLCIALAWGTIDVCRSWPYRRWLCGVTSALVLAVLMGCAWRQTSFWCDSETLWPHTIACTSPNWLAHNNFGIALASGGRVDEAVAHYRKALEIKPDYSEAHNNLANALAAQGRLDEAMAHYRKSLEIQPNYPEAYYNLGSILAGCGRLDEAIVQFRWGLAIRDNAEVRYNLGNVLARRGRFDEALAEYRKALEIQPDFAEPHNSLAWLRATCPVASLRNGAEAIEHAQQADQLCGGRRPDVLDSLAAAYAEAGWFPEALVAARKALDLAMRQNKQDLANGLRARIARYEAGKPYRETWSASAPSR
jgi:tetratricopeptide (TPR) repeat protein